MYNYVGTGVQLQSERVYNNHRNMQLTHFVVDSIAKLGSVMSDVYGGTGRRFSLVGSSGRFFAGCVRWACRSLEEPLLASNRCMVAGEQR